jgi:hypothetical protein
MPEVVKYLEDNPRLTMLDLDKAHLVTIIDALYDKIADMEVAIKSLEDSIL